MFTTASILLLALTPLGQSSAPLLPAGTAIEGWQRETLAFPLAFAPGIELEGREELAFAPGWSEAGAPDWWTYVLALEVRGPGDEPLAVDAAWFEDLLERYYRGLCSAVGASRGIEVDPERVAARVDGGGQRFSAEVDLVDAFGGGRAFTLGLELRVHPDPAGGRGVQVLGLASPAPRDADAWSELRAVAEVWEAERPLPVFLNHVYVVPDAATYAALRDSEFLREFAVVEERTTHRGDMSYTGLYLYGRNTYFEFLKPDEAIGFPAGGSGVAFGVELEGGLERLARNLEREGVPSFAAPITRELRGVGGAPDEQVPWFDILGIQAATSEQRLELFAMEYGPEFLARWHAPEAYEAGRIDRAAVLARYAEVLGGPAEPWFEDIDCVRLALAGQELARVRQVERAAGAGDEETYCNFLGPDLVVRSLSGFCLGADDSRDRCGGLMLFQGRLSRPSDDEVDHDFGQVRLQLSGDRFTLLFEGLPEEDPK